MFTSYSTIFILFDVYLYVSAIQFYMQTNDRSLIEMNIYQLTNQHAAFINSDEINNLLCFILKKFLENYGKF